MPAGRIVTATISLLAIRGGGGGVVETANDRKFTDIGANGRGRPLHADEGVEVGVHVGLDGRSLGALSAAPPPPQSPKPYGDEFCKCLSAAELASRFPSDPLKLDSIESYFGPNANLTAYGVGCRPHDMHLKPCSSASNGPCVNTVPSPLDCDFSHCQRSFCYVDPAKCSLMHKPSVIFGGRYFSYAACGFMDSFTYTKRLSSLRGKTFNVAFNSNTGGWTGAYHPTGQHFAVDQRWGGPIVNFVRQAALEGGFSMNVTSPPDFLRKESEKYFGKSSFDYCVYAAALGYVDLCVASYTVSDKRASVTSFFETSSDSVYLVVFKEEGGRVTWESFRTSFLTIFQPFTLGSWLMIVFFSLPVLGLLMLFHEYKAPGGCYPATVPVALQNARTGLVIECTAKKVPAWRHIFKSVYTSFLAFFQESYDVRVVSIGGKVNIIAISSFILLVLAVYTANLAAIL
uniref:Ionotropic glutamate receptor C-terminal domain-containing protein n=1 Tax=Odontella aurita TaxID=265563 RepID=A0A7S4NEA8_9STRA|mmetsp:Transcript_60595/g.179626  ORF Transcript_60595/g.179626 Transcript_60595/m.179626 type:complete len:458 (+) Transcript_60595:44-1417(+)